MLKFALDLAGSGATWLWRNGCWTAGRSWIEPFDNPALEPLALTDGRSTFLTVRERMAGAESRQNSGVHAVLVDSTTYQAALQATTRWPLEYFLIEARDDSSYHLLAGAWGTASVYVTITGTALHGTWSLPDLRQLVTAENLNERAVAHYLTRWPNYSRETLFRHVHKFTERSTGVFTSSGLTMRYPEEAPHAAPRELREDADVVATYEAILSSSLGRWVSEPTSVAVELSGGLDSANVAASMATAASEPVMTYGLLIDGEAGAQQRRRRAELVRHGRFRAHTVSASAWPPFCPAGRRARGEPFNPDDEPYGEALEAILSVATAAGVRVVFTGIGGDELLSLRSWESTEQRHVTIESRNNAGLLTSETLEALEPVSLTGAPTTLIPEPSLNAMACRSPVFLRMGCWPVSPLCTPELIRFCEWIPPGWRRDKRLHRARLENLRFSREVTAPSRRENFSHIMRQGLRCYGHSLLNAMRAESMLVDLGYVDGQALIRFLTHLDTSGSVPLDNELYEIVNLELSLRRLLRR